MCTHSISCITSQYAGMRGQLGRPRRRARLYSCVDGQPPIGTSPRSRKWRYEAPRNPIEVLFQLSGFGQRLTLFIGAEEGFFSGRDALASATLRYVK